MLELIDFGDSYLPSVLIRSILYFKHKSLFMNGNYSFNDILYFLNSGNYEDIYKKEYLTYNVKQIESFNDKIKNYSRSPRIINSKLNFGFQNDYNYDVSNNCINNYKFIVEQFNTKIAEFKKSLKNENPLIFINFSFYENIKTIKIDEMIKTLNKMVSKKYYIYLFFYEYQRMPNNIEEQYSDILEDKFNKYENVKVIFLKSNFNEWWNLDEKNKVVLYGEIRENFLKASSDLKLSIFQ